ncbi:hypothetical protein ABZ468_55485 [Streptomyces sp. NPDC005708]
MTFSSDLPAGSAFVRVVGGVPMHIRLTDTELYGGAYAGEPQNLYP